jgi:hypothetical protein
LFLLSSIADDLQQRLFSLREHHFNVREKVVNTFKDIYHVDITPLIPPDQLAAYHEVEPDLILRYAGQHGIEFTRDERKMLRQLIRHSGDTASQLQADIKLTNDIHSMLLDWIQALTTRFARTDIQWWEQSLDQMENEPLH